MKTVLFSFLAFIISAFSPRESNGELSMNTHGNITVAPYVHGFNESEQLNPGYRSDFSVLVDFFKYKGFVFNSLLGTTTIISAPENHEMTMDRIRYTLTPGFRFEFPSWLIKGTLHHECIHTVSRPERNGSIWWNSFQLGCGTKGSYYLYIRDEYRKGKGSFLSSWDAQINAGYSIPAARTLFSGQNHDYTYELFSIIRYHIASSPKWMFFSSLRQNSWAKEDKSLEHQVNITFNMFRKGTIHFAGFFYTYTIYDTFTLDNSDGLGSVGLKIIY